MTDIDISPKAVERLADGYSRSIGFGTATTLRALSAALTQSRAETAAAYERAAQLAWDQRCYSVAEICENIRALRHPTGRHHQ